MKPWQARTFAAAELAPSITLKSYITIQYITKHDSTLLYSTVQYMTLQYIT